MPLASNESLSSFLAGGGKYFTKLQRAKESVAGDLISIAYFFRDSTVKTKKYLKKDVFLFGYDILLQWII